MRKATQSPPKGTKKKSSPAPDGGKIESTDLVVRDDASVASAKSYDSSITGGSPTGGSIVGSLRSGARDSDSELSILQKKLGGVVVEKFKLETCTVLVFISLDGVLSEYPLTKRIMAYSELQREIARIKPKTRKMYIIQDITGVPISSKNFPGYDLIRIKEICVKPRFEQLKHLRADWESTLYHEAVHNAPEDGGDGVSFLSHNSDDEDYPRF